MSPLAISVNCKNKNWLAGLTFWNNIVLLVVFETDIKTGFIKLPAAGIVVLVASRCTEKLPVSLTWSPNSL